MDVCVCVCVCVCVWWGGIYLAQNGAVVNTMIDFGVEAADVLLIAAQGGGMCSEESYSICVRSNRFFYSPKSSSPVSGPT